MNSKAKPKTTKTIKLSNNYQPNIESIKDEQNRTDDVINNIYSRFMTEANSNNMQYALDTLVEYRYVPNTFILPTGRFIRYIDTNDHANMILKLGGFVISDNGYSIVYKSCATEQRIVKVNKKHCIVFLSINYDEQLRCSIKNM